MERNNVLVDSLVSYQHDCEVDRDDGLEEERFEVVGHVGDDDEEHGGDVDGQHRAKQSPGIVRVLQDDQNVRLVFAPI